MKQLFSFLFVLLATATTYAHNAFNYIPPEASFVFTINLDKIVPKLPLDKMEEMESYEKAIRRVLGELGHDNSPTWAEWLSHPQKTGIDLNAKSFLSIQSQENGEISVVWIPLKDKTAFEQFRKEKLPQTPQEQDGFMYVEDRGALVAWSDNAILLISGHVYYDGEDWDNEALVDNYSINAYKAYMKKIAGLSPENSLMNNELFAKHLPEYDKHDIGLWISPEFTNMWVGADKVLDEDEPYLERFRDLAEGLYAIGVMDLDKGQATVQTKTFMNKALQNFHHNITQTPINPKFFEYLDASDQLGYFGVALDIQNLIKNEADLAFHPLFTGDLFMSLYTGYLFGDMRSILQAMNESETFRGFKGDLLVSCSGITTYTYEYDDIIFDEETGEYKMDDEGNYEYETVTREEIMPTGSIMMTYKKKAEKELISLVDQYGVASGFLIEEKKGVFKVNPRDEDNLPEMYLIFNKGLLCFSNDPAVIQGMKAGKGLFTQNEDSKKMAATTQMIFIDFEEIVKEVRAAKTLPVDGDFEDFERMEFSQFKLNTFRAKGDHAIQEMEFSLKDKENNILYALLKAMNHNR